MFAKYAVIFLYLEVKEQTLLHGDVKTFLVYAAVWLIGKLMWGDENAPERMFKIL